MAPVRVLPLLLALAACSTPEPASEPTGDAGAPGAPEYMLGAFVDDYETTYEITDSTWRHGSTTYRADTWDPDGLQVLLTSVDEAGDQVWMRVDWVDLPSTDEEGSTEAAWGWAWCMAVWDAESRDAALATPASQRDEPHTGCGDGFPFTRMQPVRDLAMDPA